MITEVQITCVVLMALMTFILSYSLPKKKEADPVTSKARRMLAAGTSLVGVHFLIQYSIEVSHIVTPELRTAINLYFGIPVSYLFNLSLLYLLRRGTIARLEWTYIPLIYLLSIVLLTAALKLQHVYPDFLHYSNITVSLLYAFTLISANLIQLQVYLKGRREYFATGSSPIYPLIQWSRWSILVMTLGGLGLPIMTFCPDLAWRSFYGIFIISTAFFYIFSFVGYYINSAPIAGRTSELSSKDLNRQVHSKAMNEEKIKQIDGKIAQLVDRKFHHTPGVSIKEMAAELNVSRNTLNEYFQQTPYGKFSNWLMHLRLEDAKSLLLTHPDWTNETIAQECGFRNRAYFQSQFGEHVGTSPSKWIKAHTPTSETE